jgi:hypothetical protein
MDEFMQARARQHNGTSSTAQYEYSTAKHNKTQYSTAKQNKANTTAVAILQSGVSVRGTKLLCTFQESTFFQNIQQYSEPAVQGAAFTQVV